MIEGENCIVHVASTGEKYQAPSSSTKLLAMSTRMQELQNVPGQYGSAFGRQSNQ